LLAVIERYDTGPPEADILACGHGQLFCFMHL